METDLHLATQVYRAVENRRSLLAATHGGFSAWIDASGRIREIGARKSDEVVYAEVYCVKTRPQGLLRIKTDDGYQTICLFDIIRRVGHGVFVVSVIAAFIGRAVTRIKRRRENWVEVKE